MVTFLSVLTKYNILLMREEANKYFPTNEQLFGLYSLLTFLQKGRIYWFDIHLIGSIIKIKAEPPKGEIDLQIYHVDQNGRCEIDEWENRLY